MNRNRLAALIVTTAMAVTIFISPIAASADIQPMPFGKTNDRSEPIPYGSTNGTKEPKRAVERGVPKSTIGARA